jgi:hypothetical protein
MADMRSLKIALLADVKNFVEGLDDGTQCPACFNVCNCFFKHFFWTITFSIIW